MQVIHAPLTQTRQQPQNTGERSLIPELEKGKGAL